ncbi:MAG TPA: valine--tRNA ligase [Actinomycetota bacterium]|jgi:valyl-tRNA synthetase|nr:valine--tRNA ligase [Actinomycetota bacterium]
MTELAKAYDPKGVEERWYSFWEDRGFFRAPTGAEGDPFCIVIPPPNITGALHLGHALNNGIQDVLVRRARMQGRPTLWQPGTDHAAIATQNVIERRLAQEGLTRFDLGREEFERRFWLWKEEYETRILGQFKMMGFSCDWSRTRFTMDEGLSAAVRTVFVRLYEEGYIYRGNRIINWCPRCQSAISDIEVNHIETEGELVTIRYPLKDVEGHISVATTRVETMLGDTGVAVNPSDDRYKALIGKVAILPLVGRELPIVGDDAVDPEFGTGAVKVTPAHDPNDFEIAQRHGLPPVNIFDQTATVNEDGGRFAGLGRYEARKAVLEALKADGAVEHEERPYLHAVGHCDRCDTEIEPWLSEQWFVAMKDLAAPAIQAVRSGEVQFVPKDPFERMYLDWMDNIRDWCISRQLWLGHRIPAWYCGDGHITVAMTDPEACEKCGSSQITRDEDTLDTWFSSGLWPFSTLGWPEDTPELRYWYPTNVLSTDRAIIYLWVARMIFLGLHFVGRKPFDVVLIHPTIRDAQGRPMSKSRGNTIEPDAVVERHGTDALRFSLMWGCVLGQDMGYAEDRIEGARRFVNKLWNASRFVLNTVGDEASSRGELALPERWILSRLAQTVIAVDGALERYEFSEAAHSLYEFAWSEYCDWYLEMAKLASGERAAAVRSVLLEALETTLRLAHPIMPFVTEEIWQRLPRAEGGTESIMVAPWPSADRARIDADAEDQMSFLQEIVVEVRRFRHEHGIPPRKEIAAVVNAKGSFADLVSAHHNELQVLAGLESVTLGAQPEGWSRTVAGQAEIYLPLGELVDVGAERQRLSKEIADEDALAARARAKLDNPKFTSGAPADVVEKAQRQFDEHSERAASLRAQVEELPS